MAEKVLSQAEVDALLKGVSEGSVDTRQTEGSLSGIRPYDLTSQERIIRGRMPNLEIINERFARFFQASVSSLLRKEVEFTPGSVEVTKFGEFMKKIPLPSSINLLKMDALRGVGVLVLDAALVYQILDLLFGGKGQTHVKVEGREFTPIEQKIIRKFVGLMVEDLQKAWTPVHPVRISCLRSEINPQFAMVVAPAEVAVTMSFKFDVGGAAKEVYLCLPYPTIEPIREKLYGGFQSDQLEVDREWAQRFRDRLLECSVRLMVELGTASLTVEEVIGLREGDVIVLEKGSGDELMLCVEGRPKFLGRPGSFRGKPALQISGQIRDQKEPQNG